MDWKEGPGRAAQTWTTMCYMQVLLGSPQNAHKEKCHQRDRPGT